MRSFLFILFLVTISNFTLLATGVIQGKITEAITGEEIIGANVFVQGTYDGVGTDIEGNYVLELSPGKYSLEITAIGYQTKVITEVIVIEKQNNTLNIVLNPAIQKLEEAVISVQANKRNNVALIALQRRSANVLNGISSESISKAGDGTAAAAMKRITGVSVEDGKYVYVRGLGDRYTKTTLNGMTIPGLNPDKNTVQMNLFPANIIDNIVVYKTFTPNLPGDFTGGLVDIATKDFPNSKTLSVSIGLGITSDMNFNKSAILYNTGSHDWLGFAGKERRLHFNPRIGIPDETENNTYLGDITSGFNRELGVKKSISPKINHKYAIVFGNQYRKQKAIIGLNLALNYASKYTFYDDVYQGLFFKDVENPNNYQLIKQEVTTGSIGQQEVLWSGLINGAIKYKKHTFSASLLHSQNGTGKAADYISQDFDETNATLYKDAIEYSQKSVTNLLLRGKHTLKEDKTTLEWKISPTYSNILEPDVRSTRLSFNEESNTFSLQLGDGAGIDRFYRDLNEVNLASDIDFTLNFDQKQERIAKIKMGISNIYKSRDYAIMLYQFHSTTDFDEFTEDPNTILTNNHLWNSSSQSGMYVTGNRDLNNEYRSTSMLSAAYVMNEIFLTSSLKAIYGVRVENAKINYNGYYNNTPLDSLVHDELCVLPSLNLVHKLTEKMNIRGSFSKTVARPSFKEKSNAHIDDPISQTVFIGNINLQETKISNLDLRWENYFSLREMISVSGFFKQFSNPIELVPFELNPNNIQPKNIKEALVYGAELEFKRRLTQKPKLHVDLSTNLTYIISKVNTKDIKVDELKSEYDLRVENARTGEDIEVYRAMQGQAPYIINTMLNFGLDSLGLETNISYNVQGKRLVIVGSGIVPDVYEAPFHSLNLKTTYRFGANDQAQISLSIKNILNQKFNQFYDSIEADTKTYLSYSKESSFGIGFRYKF